MLVATSSKRNRMACYVTSDSEQKQKLSKKEWQTSKESFNFRLVWVGLYKDRKRNFSLMFLFSLCLSMNGPFSALKGVPEDGSGRWSSRWGWATASWSPWRRCLCGRCTCTARPLTLPLHLRDRRQRYVPRAQWESQLHIYRLKIWRKTQ